MEAETMSIADIRAGFADGRIVCGFQPIVRIRDQHLVSVEALARYHHPVAGVLKPEMFIPQIEAAGLGGQLMEAVTRYALGELGAEFFRQASISLAINLPLDVFLDLESLGRMLMNCREAAMDPTWLVIELTESLPICDFGALADALRRWGEAGFQTSIDDAGPKTRNLPSLFELPFSAVKLDKDVVQSSSHNLFARASLRRTIEAAKQHSLTVVAEGIEDEAGWQRMALMGVDEIQGYLVSEPMSASDLPGWVSAWQARTAAPVDA